MARPPADLDRPYLHGDPIPMPEVVERSSESAWALWEDVNSGRQRIASEAPDAAGPHYAATEPAPMALRATVAAAAPEPPRVTLEGLMVLARRNGRVCPRPRLWMALFEELRALAGAADPVPVPPLTQETWHCSSSLQKRLVLRDQMDWAERNGHLPVLAQFLVGMAEDDWLHMG